MLESLKKYWPIIIFGVLLFSASCISDRRYDAGYDAGYEEGFDNGVEIADESEVLRHEGFEEGYQFAIDTVTDWLPEENCYDEIISNYFAYGPDKDAYDTGYEEGFNNGLRAAGENPSVYDSGYWTGYSDGYGDGYAEAYKLVP